MRKHPEIGKRYFAVKDAIFQRTVHVFINYSSAEFYRWSRKRGYKDDNPDTNSYDSNFAAFSTCLEDANAPAEWVIVVRNFEWRISDQGTLIHEIVHTIVKIWAMNNIPFNADTQEFLAHSIGNLYEDIAGKIFHCRKSRSK